MKKKKNHRADDETLFMFSAFDFLRAFFAVYVDMIDSNRELFSSVMGCCG